MIVIALFLGFAAGILVNFLADYLPANRHYELASTNPFVSRDVIPPKPRFRPLVPRKYAWSSTIAAIAKAPLPDHPKRHIITELGLAAAFAWITWLYPTDSHLAFLLFYAAVFVIVAIIDIEQRWIMWE